MIDFPKWLIAACIVVVGCVWLAHRATKADWSGPRTEAEEIIATLRACRGELRLIAFLIGGAILLLGILADLVAAR